MNQVDQFFFPRQLEEAAEIALQNRNEDELNMVLAKCGGNRMLAEKVNQYKSQLHAKR